jgi:hypothetical protein
MAQRGTDGVVVEDTAGAETSNGARSDVQDGGGIFNRKKGASDIDQKTGMRTEIEDFKRAPFFSRLKGLVTGNPTVPIMEVKNNGQPAYIVNGAWLPGMNPAKELEIRVINPDKKSIEIQTSGVSATSGVSQTSGVSRLTGVYGDDVFAQMEAELRRHGKAAVEDFRRLLKTAGDNVENSKDFQELVDQGNAILAALDG